MFDVLVVGAGPGGSTTAKHLADMGYQVCLIDKSTFPRDKPCGGGFSPEIFEFFPYLRTKQDEFLERVLNVGILHSPSKEITLTGKAKMAVALRSNLDNVLFMAAHDAGADCLTGVRVKSVSIDNDGVEVWASNERKISGKVIVGADGVNSVVARESGLNRKWRQDSITACRVAEIPAREKEIVDFYGIEGDYHFYANLSGAPGYGWIFPKTETINVGVGIKANHASNMQAVFNSFASYLMKHDLLPRNFDISNAKGATVPTGGPLNSFVRNRCVLIGDSAGMVNPLTGGGILYAMEAGKIAAGVIGRCINEDKWSKESLEPYQREWESSSGRSMDAMLLAQRLFTSFLTETLFKIGDRDDKLQDMVSSAMEESEVSELDIPRLVGRFALVCLKTALHI